MNNLVTTQVSALAKALAISAGSPEELIGVLKATAFKGQVSDAQMTALLVVANQYGLNPWTKEIYAFPDKNNGIVPVVGVDGWSRIINSHPQFDGMDFSQDADSCTCTIHRKDRKHPTAVTEYMSECKRANVGPWTSHPKRMLRHKAMIQCARLAFGFVGIYEQDEAERIIEAIDVTPEPVRREIGRPNDGAWNGIDATERASIEAVAAKVGEFMEADDAAGASKFIAAQKLVNEHRIALWTLLPSTTRTALTKVRDSEPKPVIAESVSEEEAAAISEARAHQ